MRLIEKSEEEQCRQVEGWRWLIKELRQLILATDASGANDYTIKLLRHTLFTAQAAARMAFGLPVWSEADLGDADTKEQEVIRDLMFILGAYESPDICTRQHRRRHDPCYGKHQGDENQFATEA